MNTGIELPPTPNPPKGRGTFSRVIFRGCPPAKNDTKGVFPFPLGRGATTQVAD